MISISIRGQMQYKASFIMMAIGEFFINAVEVAGVWALFTRFGALEDWNLAHVCVFYGLVHISFSIADAISTGFDQFGPRFIRTGQFDRVLLRPRSIFLQVFGHEIALRRVGRFLQGVIVLTWGLYALEVDLELWHFALMFFTIAGALCFFLALFVFQATISFWSIESLELMNTMTYGGVESAQYPLAIYERWFRQFFTYVIPLACVAYFPVIAILGIDDPLGSSFAFQVAAPLAGFAFLGFAVFVFHRVGLTHYASTGS